MLFKRVRNGVLCGPLRIQRFILKGRFTNDCIKQTGVRFSIVGPIYSVFPCLLSLEDSDFQAINFFRFKGLNKQNDQLVS